MLIHMVNDWCWQHQAKPSIELQIARYRELVVAAGDRLLAGSMVQCIK